MKMYINYFFYLLRHKLNVFKVCWKKKMYFHAFTHDLSKFFPNEFIPYARWFYGKKGNRLKDIFGEYYDYLDRININLFRQHNILKKDFDYAWKKHYSRNKHHWQYWIKKKNYYFDEVKIEYTEKDLENICDGNLIIELKDGILYEGNVDIEYNYGSDNFATYLKINNIDEKVIKRVGFGKIESDMSEKYIKQMISDWEAMAIEMGDTAEEYYTENKDKIKISEESKNYIETYFLKEIINENKK